MLFNSVFCNFKRGDMFKRLCNDYGFTVHDCFSAYRSIRVYDNFHLEFQYSRCLYFGYYFNKRSLACLCLSCSLSLHELRRATKLVIIVLRTSFTKIDSKGYSLS